MMAVVRYQFKVERFGQDASSASAVLALNKPLGVLGRGLGCDYVLNDDDRVLSRRHAEIEQVDGRVYWTDLGTNASQFRGVPLVQGDRQQLNEGDQIHAGPFLLTLQLCNTQSIWNTPTPSAEVLQNMDWPAELPQKALGIDDLLRDEDPSAVPEIRTPWHAMRVPVGNPPKGTPKEDEKPGFTAEQCDGLVNLLRESLVGYQKLLTLRQISRAEMGTSCTVMGPLGNNPIKHAVSVDELLAQLLQPAGQGFLSAEQSIQAATQDLLAHQQFSAELLRTFSLALFQSLHPKAVENVYAKTGGLDLGFSIQKKARLWDEYCKRFDQLSDNRSNPFSSVLEKVILELTHEAHQEKTWK